MPWQQLVLDVALEVDPVTRRLVYREVILTVPRQSGKTTLLLVLILLRALSEPRQTISYTAQTGSDARKKWQDGWLPVLKPSPFGKTFKPRLTNGHEALLFHNGSVQNLVSTTVKSGHGGTLDLGILDEAFAHPDARLEQALKPAMITRPQPQLWIVSTAGTPESSPYLWGKVEAGRQLTEANINRDVAYFEWSAPDDMDPSDPATWRSCMPALGHTVNEAAIAADFASMATNEFERAYLNRWKAGTTDAVISAARWAELADPESKMDGRVVLAIDIPPDRQHGCIAAAGERPDGKMHIEVVEQQPGTSWMAHELVRLVEKHHPAAVVCDPVGPAGSVVVDVERAGVKMTMLSAREHAQACGHLLDAVNDGTLRHLGTPDLVAAVDGAVKRPLGDAWAWSRRGSAVDVSPLVACTLALWGAHTLDRSEPSVWSLDDLVREARASMAESEGDTKPAA